MRYLCITGLIVTKFNKGQKQVYYFCLSLLNYILILYIWERWTCWHWRVNTNQSCYLLTSPQNKQKEEISNFVSGFIKLQRWFSSLRILPAYLIEQSFGGKLSRGVLLSTMTLIWHKNPNCSVSWLGGFRSLGVTPVARVSTIKQICGGIDLGQSAPVCTELTLVAPTLVLW